MGHKTLRALPRGKQLVSSSSGGTNIYFLGLYSFCYSSQGCALANSRKQIQYCPDHLKQQLSFKQSTLLQYLLSAVIKTHLKTFSPLVIIFCFLSLFSFLISISSQFISELYTKECRETSLKKSCSCHIIEFTWATTEKKNQDTQLVKENIQRGK